MQQGCRRTPLLPRHPGPRFAIGGADRRHARHADDGHAGEPGPGGEQSERCCQAPGRLQRSVNAAHAA